MILDASALLALLQREPGADVVEHALPEAVMSVANLAEVLGKAADWGLDPDVQYQLIAALGIRFEAVTSADALQSARVRRLDSATGPVLSLGDRLCLSLAIRLDTPVLTADAAWARVDHDVEVQFVR